MTAAKIDGKALAQKVRGELAEKVAEMKAKNGRVPGLAVVLVGEDPASQVYVRMKGKACDEAGFKSVIDRMPESTTTEELLAKVEAYNNDETINGILVQLPLPDQIDEKKVLYAIKPEKDVDGFHPVSVGLLNIGETKGFAPCTPAGVMEMFKEYNIDVEGKNAVVIGRSNIVGKPMAALLTRANATVTICHSRTKDIASICRDADIIVAAIGKAKFVTADMVKEGAVVIDVGMNRVDEKLMGDVDYEAAAEKASYITPVPGGVGPMTIAMLLANTYRAFEQSL
ncbi:bifunctional methylenetetrahydrofolate dehydrogenase/methenyltetrahydrofolate cyclohydrolase FolD [Limisalsivibrio acetivorans]|uniref:bifunctional methylenetetrahydrofolate dehydrogenase/methenyltetrahydrofolate cyclohydrolase FolD n=1 Tax=Limisalsivibrio acetivorans TaxID=1304888 RepID=UPI0003B4F787|nr:bifunctional methylenetetrahydrofolate dehydrogenase/methenyltetrahydrofolate cyclohydrolase FolD [Limisalsivibrio acetivorans]